MSVTIDIQLTHKQYRLDVLKVNSVGSAAVF